MVIVVNDPVTATLRMVSILQADIPSNVNLNCAVQAQLIETPPLAFAYAWHDSCSC